MLDYVVFAVTAVLGLVFVLIFFLLQGKKKKDSDESMPPERIPGWNKEPTDATLGDLGEMAAHGSLHQYLLHRHDMGHCPITSFWWGPTTRVVSVCSPDGFRDTKHLTNRPKKLFELFEPLITSQSIQYANDDDWAQRRRTLYHTFKGSHLESYYPHFLLVAKETAERWDGYAKEGKKVGLVEESFCMTIKGFSLSCLGNVFKNNKEVARLSEAYHSCWREMERRMKDGDPEPGSKRDQDFQESRGVIRSIVQEILDKNRTGDEDSEELPFIHALLSSQVPEEQIVADTISFMIGGFHTSGNLLVWMLWFLSTNPTVLEELYEEVLGTEDLKAYALSENTYMRQVQDESLRMSTLGPYAARYSDSEETVVKYRVPPNTPIIHALGVALKSEVNWDNVNTFDPSRFEEKRGLEFCPFGVPSQRKCPGYLFSYFEVAVFAAFLLKKFRPLPVEGQKVEMVHGLVTEPKQELFVTLEKRE